MNKRAAAASKTLPLWQIGEQHSIFAGPLHYNAPHAHSVPVLVMGLHGKFEIRFRKGHWQRVEAALVRAGTPYELEVSGYPICVIYLEPTIAGFNTLRPLVTEGEECDGAIVGRCHDLAFWRSVYEDTSSSTWVRSALDDIVTFHSRGLDPQSLDQRIVNELAYLHQEADCVTTSDCASRQNLSTSRFQHLFSEQVGVPFRRYRSWCRLRMAVRDVVSGASFTSAAHCAGFSDHAHFSRMFRQTFGAPPSATLSDVRR